MKKLLLLIIAVLGFNFSAFAQLESDDDRHRYDYKNTGSVSEAKVNAPGMLSQDSANCCLTHSSPAKINENTTYKPGDNSQKSKAEDASQ